MNVPASARTKRARVALRLVVAAVLLFLILRHTPPDEIAETLVSASVAPLLAGAALGAVFSALKVFRWGWLLGRLGVPCGEGEALRSYLGGMALGLTTPGRLGEAGRSLYLRGDRAFVTGAALLDKVLDVAVILAVGGAGCAANGLAVPGAAFLLGSAALIVAIALPPRVLLGTTALLPAALRSAAARMIGPLERMNRATLAKALAQAVGSFLVTALQFHLFLAAIAPAPAGATLYVLPLMILSNLVPITISGVGVREWASVLLFRRFGVSAAAAVAVAWLIYLCNSLLPGLAGAAMPPQWTVEAAEPRRREVA
jgi:uncharacterized membrane protein YbhN (UPF0104 family)